MWIPTGTEDRQTEVSKLTSRVDFPDQRGEISKAKSIQPSQEGVEAAVLTEYAICGCE